MNTSTAYTKLIIPLKAKHNTAMLVRINNGVINDKAKSDSVRPRNKNMIIWNNAILLCVFSLVFMPLWSFHMRSLIYLLMFPLQWSFAICSISARSSISSRLVIVFNLFFWKRKKEVAFVC